MGKNIALGGISGFILFCSLVIVIVGFSTRVWLSSTQSYPVGLPVVPGTVLVTRKYGLWTACFNTLNTATGAEQEFGCGYINSNCDASFCGWLGNSLVCFTLGVQPIENCAAFITVRVFSVFVVIGCIAVLCLTFPAMEKKVMAGLLSASYLATLICFGIVVGCFVGAVYKDNTSANLWIPDFYELDWSFWLIITSFVLTFVAWILSFGFFVGDSDNSKSQIA